MIAKLLKLGWHSWQESLAFRLSALALVPLLLALPVVVLAIALIGTWISDTQIADTLRGNLTGSENYLAQLRERTRQQIAQYAKSEKLAEMLDRQASQRDFESLLDGKVKEWGLSYLILAQPDGRVIASGSGLKPGGRLPDSFVLRQARIGISNAAIERFESDQLNLFIPPSATSATALKSVPGEELRASSATTLVINAAAHTPLAVDRPEAILIGGVTLNGNTALVEHVREIIFPVVSHMAESGMIAIHSGDMIVARTRRHSESRPVLGFIQPQEIAQAVLERGQVWAGRIVRDDASYTAAFSPILDGEGQRVGMLGVALPDQAYRNNRLVLIASVIGLSSLAMLAISLVFLRAGRGLTGRIQTLNTVMSSFRDGASHVRVGPLPPADELGRLALSFDQLLETINDQETRLRVRNDELVQMGQALHAQHSRLNQVVAGTRAGTWAWNVRTGETQFNERWAEILGYTLDELQPVSIRTWEGLTHPEDLERSREALQRHFSHESSHYDLEVRMRHKDGHWVWVHDRGAVSEWTTDGRPLWMYGTHLDVSERHEAEAERNALLSRLQHLSSNVPGCLYQYTMRPDGSAFFSHVSQGIVDVYGCTPEDVSEDAAKVFDLIHPDDLEATRASIMLSAKHLTPWRAVYRVRHPVKGERWIEGSASPERSDDAGVTWHGYLRDVTEQQQVREQLKLAASVYAASHEGIIIADDRQRIIDVNPACLRITGYGREELLGQTTALLDVGRHSPELYREQAAALLQNGNWKGEVSIRNKSGECVPQLWSISAVLDEAGHLSHSVTVLTDIRQLKAQQDELDRIANYDALTGIPNRRLLRDRLAKAMAYSRRHGTPLAICMMDLDGFKPVNDTYGHGAGDLLLIEIANRLTKVLRTDDTIARLGGDEFVLIFNAPVSTAVFDRVLETVRAPVDVDDAVVHVSASMGVAYFHKDLDDGDLLLREADQALYQSKERGRNRYTIFVRPDAVTDAEAAK
jgi:diguanylate cyclase (GGDEF)-like protein/PAS domain S-box-containing protein